MATRVKICGVRSAADVAAAASAGADFVGLNFCPTSKRYVEPEVAEALAAAVPDGGPAVVGVFQDLAAGDVMRIARRVGLDVIQLHGDEPPAYCSAIGGFEVWKALRGPDVDGETVRAYAGWCDALVLDGRDAGSGQGWAWERVRAWLDDGGQVDGADVWLAGGLAPENVAEALRASGARGADVASGVERDGEIDAERVRAFVRNARGESE